MWLYMSSYGSNDVQIVFWQNRIYNMDRQRFRIHRPQSGVFDLIISNVKAYDAGIYRCRVNKGRYPGETCTELIVTGQANLVWVILSLLFVCLSVHLFRNGLT